MKRQYVNASWDDTNALDDLFDELVPASGKADTVAGEIVRAACRIGGRWFNDGDQIGCGYGKITCNSAARYLIAKCDSSVANVINKMWSDSGLETDEDLYTSLVEMLSRRVVNFIEDHPELRDERNTEDFMVAYHDPDDEKDDWEDEDDWDSGDYY